jgi:glycolate oxidase
LVKLIARPLFVRAACAEFSSLNDASRTVNDILSTGITPVALEIMDKTAIVCIEEAMHPGLSKDAEAVLLIETDGSDEAAVLREIETASGICRKNGAHNVKVAENEAQRTDLWSARRCVSPSLARKAPNKLGEDITVPRGAIPEAIKRIRGISARYDIPIVIFGHAGDGNLHPNILFDNRDPSQRKKAKSVAGEIFETALALGGTLSGEHGVGVLKRPYMEKALGPLSVEMQRRIKQAFDPLNIMNPGKVLPDR